MGRYAQARRRGGTPPTGPGIPAPPAPVLSVDDGSVHQHAQGLNDDGGRVVIYATDPGDINWLEFGNEVWVSNQDWGVVGLFEDLILRAKEVGNGVDYVGDSEWSNVLGPL